MHAIKKLLAPHSSICTQLFSQYDNKLICALNLLSGSWIASTQILQALHE
jgi:hypothetical protein